MADAPKSARSWHIQLDLSKREQKSWVERGKKIVRRYRDERDVLEDGSRKFNILWSNVQTLLPAVYAKKPRAEVDRREKDADPVGRCAAMILERALQYEIDHYQDYHAAIRNSVLDRLLPGRGVAWVRFEPHVTASQQVTDDVTEDERAEPVQAEEYETECTPTDYVYWEDFRHAPARTWEEVPWVARRVYMSREEGVSRFGEDFNKVPLSHQPKGLKEDENVSSGEVEAMKKAQVWEIWNKPAKQAIWVADSYEFILDERPDPLQLDDFFPCPKPLFATLTTDTLIPVPDFSQYQDQANELDEITERIHMLVKACKVVGVYDASQKGIERMLTEGFDNALIPVDSWAAFAEKGGIKGVIDWLPLDMVVQALTELYKAEAEAKQKIYEVTGLSDIIRGASLASETATAQQLKAQFGSIRLKESQQDVARFATDLLRIKAQIMASLYRPETLVAMSGIQQTADAQYIPQALQLLRTEPLRAFRIEVAADSLVELDEQAEKQSRVEFLTAAGNFLQKAVPAAQAFPQLGPLMAEMLMFGIRSFKAGRPLEAAFDNAMKQLNAPQPPKPDPEMEKVKAEQQQKQAELQAEMQAEQMRNQMEAQRAQMQAEMDMRLEQQKMAMQAELQQQQAAFDAQFQRWKAELDAAVKVEVANISAKAKTADQATAAAEGEIAREVK